MGLVEGLVVGVRVVFWRLGEGGVAWVGDGGGRVWRRLRVEGGMVEATYDGDDG